MPDPYPTTTDRREFPRAVMNQPPGTTRTSGTATPRGVPPANPRPSRRPGVGVSAFRALAGIFFLLGFACLLPARAQTTRRMIVTTNYVIVTNTVIVTNYVDVPEPPAPAASLSTTSAPPATARPPLLAPVFPPDAPPDAAFDWVQLKSGEWLKGRIRALQDESLDFESEELEDQEIQWKDVRELRSGRPMVIEFRDRRMIRGPVAITPDEVRVGSDGAVTQPRTNLFGLTPGGERELDHWTAKVSAGLNVRTGNTEQTDFDARVDLRRRTPNTRLNLEYTGAFSHLEGVKSEDSHRVNALFDYWLSPRFFARLPFLEYFRDPFQNVAGRATAGAGIGYDLFHRPRFEWDLTTGPAFQQVWFDSVPEGEDDAKSAAAIVFGTHLEWEISKRIDLTADYRGQYTRREIGETTHHAEIRFEFELTKTLDLDFSAVWDRISHPKEAGNGVTPEPDDFRFITTVGLKF